MAYRCFSALLVLAPVVDVARDPRCGRFDLLTPGGP
jgi:beta-glucosidase-like glycosyl hydrolase